MFVVVDLFGHIRHGSSSLSYMTEGSREERSVLGGFPLIMELKIIVSN